MRKDCIRAALPGVVAVLLASAGCASKTSPSEPIAAAGAKQEARPPVPAEKAPEVDELVRQAAAAAPVALEGKGWKSMFDGKTLAGWRETDFGGHGPAQIESGLIMLNMGDPFTGINWTNEVPKVNYEVALDAMRLQGSDFFCGLTFPVGESHCSLILGGWGGAIVGLSSLDGEDASENETTQFMKFDDGRWYHVRVRVTPAKIETWLDGKKIIDVTTTGRRVSLRFGDIELSKPFGVASYQTTAALRGIEIRRLGAGND